MEQTPQRVVLKLYVTGQTPRSQQAVRQLQRLASDEGFEVVVVDVLERPQLAEDERIIATPTLVKELPLPIRRVIGDLADLEQVLIGLDLAGGASE